MSQKNEAPESKLIAGLKKKLFSSLGTILLGMVLHHPHALIVDTAVYVSFGEFSFSYSQQSEPLD